MKNLREDIWAQPAELAMAAQRLVDGQSEALCEAAKLISASPLPVITGMGSSYFISLAGQYAGFGMGLQSIAVDTGELCHNLSGLLNSSVVIVVSRSGASAETIKLLEILEPLNCPLIGITNAPASPLGKAADVVLNVQADLDHNVSIKMYNGPLQVLILALAQAAGRDLNPMVSELQNAWTSLAPRLDEWEEKIECIKDLFTGKVAQYYLGRGSGYATACEGRLLCEEASKYPATADYASGFRHGSIETVYEDFRGILFMTPGTPMHLTAALAMAIEDFGGKSLLFAPDGAHTPQVSLALHYPATSPELAPLFDITPAQLLALKLAEWRGADCNNFFRCSYIISEEV